jgi:hypothetical protein
MTDEDLLGYLFDALDVADQERIEQELERDELARARLDELRRVTLLLAEDDHIHPPLGLAASTLSLVQRAEMAAERPEWSEPRFRLRALDFAVVASILCIAAVLVFPAIATLRGDQSRLVCADRLRQIGVAIAAYADQESGQLPYVAASGPMSNAGSFTVALKARDLIPTLATLLCPSANNGVVLVPEREEVLSAEVDPDRDQIRRLRAHMGGSYGYQLGYDEGGAYHGRTVGKGQLAIVSDRPPRPDEMIQSTNSPNHHFQGQNVLFADGAVRWLPNPFMGRDNLFLNDSGTVAAGLCASDIVIGVSEATPHPYVRTGM